MKRPRSSIVALALCVLLVLISAGCTTTAGEPVNSSGGDQAQQTTAEPTKKPGTTDYGVPDEDANLNNPIDPDQSSLVSGEKTYQASCLNCHGVNGDGHGPTAPRLDPEPADFRAEHVKELSDGELFYIITNGIEDSAMIPFNFLDEEKRWNLVNYIRSFQE